MKRVVMPAVLAVFLLSGLARAGNWYDTIKLKGDFRHRHELIQDESKDADRNRWRIRARLTIDASFSDDWSFHGRLATGSDDPVSTNQTLTDGFATKGFHLDRAFFAFHPGAVKGLKIVGGKMSNPFMRMEKTELIWDGDLNPEGAAVLFKHEAHDLVSIMVNGAFFYITERKADDDTWMAGAQAAVKAEPAENMHFIAGGGYYDYQEVKCRGGIFDEEDFFGNTTDYDEVSEADVYAFDFNIVEGFGLVGFAMEKVSVAAYGNYVVNTEADTLDQGYLFGATVQYGKGRNHFKVYGNYREVEANAVVGVFTDSDFRGGGTDGNGFEIGAGYGVTDKVSLGLAYFLNNKGIEEEVEYKRLQADLKMKF